MIEQIDHPLWHKANSALRQFIVRGGLSAFTKHITINEFPKSGGTWLGEMLAASMNLPFPRNRMPHFNGCIMHGHYLRRHNLQHPVLVFRDGRDVMVSMYHHYLFPNELGNGLAVKRTLRFFSDCDVQDMSSNLPRFMELAFLNRIGPGFSWPDFVESWSSKGYTQVRYEDLRQRPESELTRLCVELGGVHPDPEKINEIVARFSFESQSGRKPGEEQRGSFMRKGLVGDWRNHFSPEAHSIFEHFAGEALVELGYQ